MAGAVALGNILLSGALFGGVLALTALGLSLVLGVMRLVNVAHGEFLVGGAYLGLFLLHDLSIDPLLGLPIVAVGIGLISLPIYKWLLGPLTDKSIEAPMMTTFGLSAIAQNVFVLLFSADSRSIDTRYATMPFRFGPFTTPLIDIIGFGVALAVTGLVYLLVDRSDFGRDIRASAVDAGAAAVLGVNVARVRGLTFSIGAACAAISGVLIGIALAFSPTAGSSYLFNAFAIIVLGGIGSIPGTFVAGIVLGMIQSIGGFVLGDGYRNLVGLVIFLLVPVIRPEGLVRSGRAAA